MNYQHCIGVAAFASIVAIPFFSTPQAIAATNEGPFSENLVDKQAVETIGENAYLIQIQEESGKNQRSVYHLNPDEPEFELLTTVEGGVYKPTQEHIFSFDDDLFFTVTRKRDRKIQLYRSSDDGATWERSGKIGFSRPGLLNEVKEVYELNGSIFIIVGQNNTSPFNGYNRKQNVGVWSSTDGTNWEHFNIQAESGIGEKHMYIGSEVVDDSLFVITKSYDYESSKTIHKQIVVTSTDGATWNTQQVAADEVAALNDYVYYGHSTVDDRLAIIFFQYAVTNNTPSEYLHEEVDYGVWTTANNTSAEYEYFTEREGGLYNQLVALGSETLLLTYEYNNPTLRAYQVSSSEDVLTLLSTESLNTDSANWRIMETESALVVTFYRKNDVPLLYTVDGVTWESLGTYDGGDGSDGVINAVFAEDIYVQYPQDQMSVLIDALTGETSEDGFGFEDELDSDLSGNVEYSFEVSPDSEYLFARGTVYNRSGDFSDGKSWYDVPDFCGVTTDGSTWETFECSGLPADGFVLDNIWYFTNSDGWYALQP